jgi:hypothetical protein
MKMMPVRKDMSLKTILPMIGNFGGGFFQSLEFMMNDFASRHEEV